MSAAPAPTPRSDPASNAGPMDAARGPFECETCGAVVDRDEARRTETMGGLDPTKWQTLCCPACGARLKTVFVGDE